MKIQVTAEDIRDGERDNQCSCPIARALNRQIADKDFMVTHDSVKVWIGPSKVATLPLPQNAQEFIKSFDDWGVPDPFEFEFEL